MYDKILKKFVPVPKIEAFNRYMFIGPHPDDIEIGCAPLIAKLSASGKKIAFIIATDGRLGTTDPKLTGEKLVKIRQAEAIRSAESLSVFDVKFLNFFDGGAYMTDDLSKAIGAEITKFKPDVLFAPDFKTRAECHPDHIKTGEAAVKAVMLSGFCGWTKSFGEDTHNVKAVALYFTDKPNAYVKIGGFSKKRKECLKIFTSQFGEADINELCMYFNLREKGLGFRRLTGRAEGYRALAPVHMHCLPEASRW